MTYKLAVVATQTAPGAPGRDTETLDAFDPENVFALIEQTATTLSALQQENERIGAREEAIRAQFDRDRAQWSLDVSKLREVAEACLTRANMAETQVEEAKAQAHVALLMCREAHEREQMASARAASAEKRAETAERWLQKISHALAVDVKGLLR